MTPRTAGLVLAGLTALAAGLRFSTLGNESFWFDESVTAAIVSKPSLADVLDSVSFEATPPLYYVLAWGWGKLFGTGDVALRALPALFGTAMVPVAYWAGAKLVSGRVGLVAAALTATSPLLIHYSQENRPYSLVALLAALSLVCFLYAREEPTGRRLVLWALVSGLALTAHYFALFVVVPEGIWLLALVVARGRDRRTAVLVFGGLAALAAVLLPVALDQRGNAIAWIGETPLGYRLRDSGHQFLKGAVDAPWRGLGIAAGLCVLAAVALLLTRAERRERRAAGIPLAIAGSGLLLVLVAAADVLHFRNLIVLWVPLALVIAVGLGAGSAGLAGPAVAACLAIVWIAIQAGLVTDEAYHRPDWEQAAEALGTASEARAVGVVPYWSWEALKRYQPGLVVDYPGTVRAREVAVVGVYEPALAPSALPGLPAFRRVETDRVDAQLTVARYRSRRSVELSPPAWARRGRVLLVQLPPPG